RARSSWRRTVTRKPVSGGARSRHRKMHRAFLFGDEVIRCEPSTWLATRTRAVGDTHRDMLRPGVVAVSVGGTGIPARSRTRFSAATPEATLPFRQSSSAILASMGLA